MVPTTAPQEGLAALLAFDPAATAEDSGGGGGGGVLPAPRRGGARRATTPRALPPGDAVGYADGELVAWGSPEETLAATIARRRRGRPPHLHRRRGAPLPLEAVERAAPDGVELEYHEGGQPAWWWLFAAE